MHRLTESERNLYNFIRACPNGIGHCDLYDHFKDIQSPEYFTNLIRNLMIKSYISRDTFRAYKAKRKWFNGF